LGYVLGVDEDIVDEDAIDFVFGRGRLIVDEEGFLKMPKPEPIEIDDRDQQYMYGSRVLEGDLLLVWMAPMLWGPLVDCGVVEECGGLEVKVVDVVEFVGDVAEVFASGFLEEVVS
jgi:hypothetical protein